MLLKAMLGGFWGPAAWATYYKTLYKDNPPEDLEQYTANLLANLKEPHRFNAVYYSMFASKGAQIYLKSYSSLESCTKRIAELEAPTLVIMGSKDPDFSSPESEVKWIESHFKGLAKGVMVEGAGHYPHVEFPDKTKNYILEFINQINM